MSDVFAALSLLTPWDIDKPKIRIGPAADGGYIYADDFTPDQSVVSYGINVEYSFDAEMAKNGHSVYMFDHTIECINQTNEKMFFFKEGVAGVSDPSASLYSIEDHLARHNIDGGRLVLKMDVEGYEWETLLNISEPTLSRFEQLSIEFHDLYKLRESNYRDNFIKVFQKLNRLFTLFHVHANNYDGADTLLFVDGLPISNLLELSYIKTSSVQRTRSRTLYPTYLDYPNVNWQDKLLWIYPFFPTDKSYEDLAESYSRRQARNA